MLWRSHQKSMYEEKQTRAPIVWNWDATKLNDNRIWMEWPGDIGEKYTFSCFICALFGYSLCASLSARE